MKRFEFSLDRLLTVKRQLERLAEMEQHRAWLAVEQAREALQALHEQLTRVANQFSAAVGRTMAPGQWAAASDMTERLGNAIGLAEAAVATAEQKLRAAAEERAHLATEVEALDTLRQQQFTQWQQESRKVDREKLDDLSLRRWQATQDESVGGIQGSR